MVFDLFQRYYKLSECSCLSYNHTTITAFNCAYLPTCSISLVALACFSSADCSSVDVKVTQHDYLLPAVNLTLTVEYSSENVKSLADVEYLMIKWEVIPTGEIDYEEVLTAYPKRKQHRVFDRFSKRVRELNSDVNELKQTILILDALLLPSTWKASVRSNACPKKYISRTITPTFRSKYDSQLLSCAVIVIYFGYLTNHA